MFINKVSIGHKYQTFKGYQHEIDDFGQKGFRLNSPIAEENVKVVLAPVVNDESQWNGKRVIDGKRTREIDIPKGGLFINPMDYGFPKNADIAYKFRYNGSNYTDTGLIIGNGYNLIRTSRTTPLVQGASIMSMPDIDRQAHYDETGKIVEDKNIQKIAEAKIPGSATKLGGNIAGAELNNDVYKKAGIKKAYYTPITGNDNATANGYTAENMLQISPSMGTTENYASYVRNRFQNGIVPLYDGTFTSESVHGIHFQYALKHSEENPLEKYMFMMDGIDDGQFAFGLLPQNTENLRVKFINPPFIYDNQKNSYNKDNYENSSFNNNFNNNFISNNNGNNFNMNNPLINSENKNSYIY